MTSKVEMKSSSGSLSPILERHTPQHPLPDEIRNMENDETVCQFCGVSYLIHHEIKKLEEQVEALEKELLQCRKSRENEKILREELKKANASIQSLQAMLEERNTAIDKMTRSIEGKKTKIDKLNKEKVKLVNQEADVRNSLRKFKESVLQQSQRLMLDLNAAKAELTNFKQAVLPIHSKFAELLTQVKQDVERHSLHFVSETSALEEHVQTLRDELSSKISNEDLLQNTIKSMQSELEIASKNKDEFCNEFREENEKLQTHILSLQRSNAELLHDVATLQSQHGIVKLDAAQLKESLSKKQQEVQSAIQSLHRTEKNAEMTIQRMNQEIKHLEQDLISSNKEKKKWETTEENLKKQLEELRMQMSMSSGESQQLCQSLQDAKQELLALKNEREQMVMSHQSQITQLRESFREKLNAANGNPKELEERLRSQKEMHEKNTIELEMHFMENHAIEKGLQREKHEEEIRNHIEKCKELIEQSESDSKREIQRLARESQSVHRQFSAMKTQHSEQMAEQENEKSSLKRLITQLEEKITFLMGEQEGASITSQAELRETKRKLHEVTDEKIQVERQVDSLREEVSMLQETVQRECEERFELTEALSTIREHLKRSSKPNSPLIRTPVSAINGVQRQESFHNTNLSTKTLQSLESDNHVDSTMSVLPDVLPKNVKRNSIEMRTASNGGDLSPYVKDILFSNQPSPPLGKAVPRTKSEESVESVRRRIAAVIKRK